MNTNLQFKVFLHTKVGEMFTDAVSVSLLIENLYVE